MAGMESSMITTSGVPQWRCHQVPTKLSEICNQDVHRSDETILCNTHQNGHHKDFPTELLNVLHRNPKNIYKSELLRNPYQFLKKGVLLKILKCSLDVTHHFHRNGVTSVIKIHNDHVLYFLN